jgi:hypothetical protein
MIEPNRDRNGPFCISSIGGSGQKGMLQEEPRVCVKQLGYLMESSDTRPASQW